VSALLQDDVAGLMKKSGGNAGIQATGNVECISLFEEHALLTMQPKIRSHIPHRFCLVYFSQATIPVAHEMVMNFVLIMRKYSPLSLAHIV
jgi:hypothetical protein